jgi:hypothetical protein
VRVAVVGLTLRVLLITVLLWSSVVKSRPAGFRAVSSMLRQLGIRRRRALVGFALLGAEMATAALLAVPATTLAGSAAAMLLFAGLTGGVAVVLHKKLDVRCACFGAHTARLGPIHLVRNGLLTMCAVGAFLATVSASAGPFESGARMSVIAVLIGLLAVITGLNLFLLLGVIRRLREMSGTGPGYQGSDLPEVGHGIGRFSEYSVDGVAFTEERLAARRSLVLVLSPNCQPCRDTATRLAERREQLPARTFVLVEAEPGEAGLDTMVEALNGIGAMVVVSDTGTARAAFGVTGFPTAIVVEDGRVAFASFDFTEALPMMRERTLAR